MSEQTSSMNQDEVAAKRQNYMEKDSVVSSQLYSPTMTEDYSRISDTARAVNAEVLPKMQAYLRRIRTRIASMRSDEEFMIADYGAADGANSSELFLEISRQIHEVNAALAIKLVYIDLADPEGFMAFWNGSALSRLEHVDSQYIQRSFYERFPEIEGKLQIGFSSTALHWMNATTVGPEFFRHPHCLQPNQLPAHECQRFAEKWNEDFRTFLQECSQSLVEGGALFLANLANLGGDRWPASPGYNNLWEICQELHRERKLSDAELEAIFIPDYFATPQEMASLFEQDNLKDCFALRSCDHLTVPCAYFARSQDKLHDPQERSMLAATLARVVRAWSESSMQIGLNPDNKTLIEEVYRRLQEKFCEKPEGLPYQYCLLELAKTNYA
ncbi:MAG: SAM dependent carboxyl methyltransferase [Methanosaeta sp. PtaU1.Bin112]|nr:MAG: SAM dependent carboxyl methyltransferase [Methanosaeta sp. PtaU1.Bin112]